MNTLSHGARGEGELDAAGLPIARERPFMLLFLGFVGLAGCVALVGGMLLAAFLVPDFQWLDSTISDAAAGPNQIIMDVALFGFAAALMACSLGAAHTHLGGVFWTFGTLSLAFLAAIVVVVGARNEYGDGDTGGVVIHMQLVYAIGVLFALTPVSMAEGAHRHHPTYRALFRTLSAIWVVAAPIFFIVPDGVNGFYERMLGTITLVYVVSLSWLFFARARKELKAA